MSALGDRIIRDGPFIADVYGRSAAEWNALRDELIDLRERAAEHHYQPCPDCHDEPDPHLYEPTGPLGLCWCARPSDDPVHTPTTTPTQETPS